MNAIELRDVGLTLGGRAVLTEVSLAIGERSSSACSAPTAPARPR